MEKTLPAPLALSEKKQNVWHFDKFFSLNKNRKKSEDLVKDLIWFIGFAEGDGSWIVSTSGKKSTKKRSYFLINQKDPKVLFKIRRILGFGLVKNYNSSGSLGNKGYHRFIVADKNGTEKLSESDYIKFVTHANELHKSFERFVLDTALKNDHLYPQY